MSTHGTARAVLPCLVLVAACAAERLESRDPARGPSAAASATSPVTRPTVLEATEGQLAPGDNDDAQPKRPHEHRPPEAAEALYVCPMHPEVRSANPGECPKCGMNLVRKEPSP